MSVDNSKKTSEATGKQYCAVYTRKSTDEGLDQEFNTLDAQRESGEAFIASQRHLGWECLPDRYDDGGFSGANIERPAMKRLLADIEEGKVKVVVVYKVDRLSRSLLDFARLMEVFERQGVSFVSVTQQFNTASSMGRLILNVLLSFAQFEREMIAERTRDKIAAARRRGKWTGGQIPLGYDVVNKKLVVNETEASLVREIFDLYEERGSAIRVANTLNDKGLTTKQYTRKSGEVRGGKRWCKNAVLRVLKNPIYGGFMTHGDERYEGEHQAIVDREQLERMQALMANMKKHGARRTRNPEYLLRGILKCGQCGTAMSTASTRKRGTVHRYYRCGKRDKQGSSGCRAGQIPAEAIEEFVVDRIRETSIGGVMGKQVREALEKQIERRRAHLEEERKSIPRRIANLADDGAKLSEKITGIAEPGARLLEERIEKIGNDIASAESRLEEIELGLERLNRFELEARWVTTTLDAFDDVWDSMTIENRRRLFQLLIREVELDEKSGEVTVVLAALQIPDGEIEPAMAATREQIPTQRQRPVAEQTQMEATR
jgi:site-specific DNA recombinase